MATSPFPSPSAAGNFLQSIFWPTKSATNDDVMGRTGLGLCLAIAMYHLYALTIGRQPLVALVTAAAYVIGGCGIRAYSPVAALLLAMWELLGQLGNMLGKYPIFWTGMVTTVVLFLFVRGTWVASRREPTLEELLVFPSDSRKLQMVDRLARRLWTVGRYPFFLFGGLLVLACLFTTVMAIKTGGLQGAEVLEK